VSDAPGAGGGSLVSERMRAALGSVVDWRVSYPVAESDIRRWALAVYHPDAPPARFVEAGPGLVAPEEFNPFAWAVAERMEPVIAPRVRDPDRFEKAIGLRGPGLVHRLNGGTSARYGAPIRPGDVIRSETRLVEYTERTGRLGPMLITVTSAEWRNQRGEHVRTEEAIAIRY
jgi:hypothetical protein